VTIIAIKDGVMAVDSYITSGGLRVGSAKKWVEVPAHWGGGYAAFAGDVSVGVHALKALEGSGVFDGVEDGAMLWIKSDGSVSEATSGGAFCYEAPFYAIGSGEVFAKGAMAAGASAEEAVKLTCEWCDACGGDLHVFSVSK